MAADLEPAVAMLAVLGSHYIEVLQRFFPLLELGESCHRNQGGNRRSNHPNEGCSTRHDVAITEIMNTKRSPKEETDEYGYPRGTDKTGLNPAILAILLNLRMDAPLKS